MSQDKSTLTFLYVVIKSELKARGLTYHDVARTLGLSHNSIKHRFAHLTLSMGQIIAIAEMAGITLSDLMRKVEHPEVSQLSLEQETALVEDMRLFLVAMLVLEDWSINDIVANYDVTNAQCIKYLLKLDRLGLIDLLPNNAIRKRIRRSAPLNPGGPLHYFLSTQLGDYLNSDFKDAHEMQLYGHAALTPTAIATLQAEMTKLKLRVEALHEECKRAPASERRLIMLFAAERQWELPAFRALRRPDAPENPNLNIF